tara:strand:- start:368 stop:481 length:114 start_codon:yes stop_codon:yes gene_type:complete
MESKEGHELAEQVGNIDINKEKQKHPESITPDYVMQL